jgi:hypothetical protein
LITSGNEQTGCRAIRVDGSAFVLTRGLMVLKILMDMNSAINFCLALTLGITSLWSWYHDKGSLKWLDLLESVVGLYFAGIYIFVLIADPANYDSVVFGQMFIRPALMLLLGISAAGAIVRLKGRKSNGD